MADPTLDPINAQRNANLWRNVTMVMLIMTMTALSIVLISPLILIALSHEVPAPMWNGFTVAIGGAIATLTQFTNRLKE